MYQFKVYPFYLHGREFISKANLLQQPKQNKESRARERDSSYIVVGVVYVYISTLFSFVITVFILFFIVDLVCTWHYRFLVRFVTLFQLFVEDGC